MQPDAPAVPVHLVLLAVQVVTSGPAPEACLRLTVGTGTTAASVEAETGRQARFDLRLARYERTRRTQQVIRSPEVQLATCQCNW